MQQNQYRIMYELEEKHWWFLAKRAFIKAVLPKPRQKWKILDIGSGTGGLTTFLGSWGQIRGMENSKYAYEYLDKRKIRYFKKSVMNFTMDKKAYDLICLCDVLYHKNITDDEFALKTAYRGLKKRGLLLITDSAVKFLFSNHDKVMHARERYTLKEMEEKTKKAGFRILKKSYIYFLVFPLFVISRLINKYIKYSTVSPIPSFMNQFFLNLCKLEAHLLTRIQFPIGSSILILAEKQ